MDESVKTSKLSIKEGCAVIPRSNDVNSVLKLKLRIDIGKSSLLRLLLFHLPVSYKFYMSIVKRVL